ncbi:hypothetical protein GCG54_00006943 [Colletotrichum gloeosporioides]|uniref:NACHT domain-containing protein n=1 Tax=Colletotrichum gloeosporioides TaxID=474922 RepID=A0A8H4FN72_COLGL|nr:uncharacterized protein GCG54_00006943 [Colletotrichum gloeosporioides]KAF3808322.1 hypothetical protein GCG54_00006943 [Colletotrichum gloeosporioides]
MASDGLNSQLKDGYKRAADDFKQSIPADLAKRFAKHTNSLASLKDEIQTIQDDHGKKGSLRNLQRLKKFVEAMTQLGQVIEVFVNANDLVCFIWTAKAHLDNFDKLLDVYSDIGDVIPGLLFYQDMFIQHEPLRDILQDYYSDILKFHEKAIKVFARSTWKNAFNATWNTFKTQFDPIMQSLKKRRELLDSVKVSASLDQIHVMRREMRDVYQEQTRAADKSARENHRSRMALIKEKIGAPDYDLDQQAASQRREEVDSGKWVFGEPEYVSWSSTISLDHSVLYLNGIPGAGKSTLVSLIISNLLAVRSSNQLLRTSVSYFYFKHGVPDRSTHESALRAILTQLINQDTTSSEGFFEDLSKQADVNIRSRESLEKLTKRALEEYRVSYLILDGLDECERGQAERAMEWLLSLRKDERYAGKTSLRIMFSGQRNGVLDKILAPFPDIQLESSKHKVDIEKYCLQYSSKIQKKFRLDKATEAHIVSLVTKGAQGMFLYARVVLEYLYRQVSFDGLNEAIKPEMFPSKLETAYQRVAATIFEAEYDSEVYAAKKVISLVIAARRDLRWREIQSFFCIDSKTATVRPGRRLLVDAKELCGSLVDIHQFDGQIGDPESLVRIVHHTAQRYLIEKKLIDNYLEHARLLTFCSDYLRSMPFAQSNCSDVVSLHARQAYYSLQDYAVAHWYDHLKALMSPSPARQTQIPEVVRELQTARDSAVSFLQEYVISSKMTQKDDTELSLESILDSLPSDDSERTSLLNIDQRTFWIRKEIENLSDLTDNEYGVLNSLYGPASRYKCHKPRCLMFSEGFETKQERANHINRHERPFRCDQEECFAHAFGFESRDSRDKHVNEHHSEAGTTFQFPRQDTDMASTPEDIFQAVKAGDIVRVTQLLDEDVDVNAVDHPLKDSYVTPLWIAVDRNNYEMCRLLIQRGATLGKPAAYRPRSKRFTKVDAMSPYTPLAQACVTGNVKIAELILKAQAQVTEFAVDDMYIALMKAVMRGKVEIVQLLMGYHDFTREKHAPDGLIDPLLVACQRSHASVLECLLQSGFELRDDVDYITVCLSFIHAQDTEQGTRQASTLKIMLASCQVPISSPMRIERAMKNGHPYVALLILSYRKTNIRAAGLRKISSLARERSYTDIAKFADKLLDAIGEEPQTKSVLTVGDMPISFDFDSLVHEDWEMKEE